MNITVELLRKRRSVPPNALAEPGPSPEELDTILEVAARVPDHGRLVPWRFLVFEGEGRARAGRIIAGAFTADQPDADEARIRIEHERLALAPLVVAVVCRARPHAKIPEWEQQLSAGAVCMNLMVAANALGFSTSWLTQWYAFDRRVLDGFGLAPDETVAGFVHVGTASTASPERERPVLADIVARF